MFLLAGCGKEVQESAVEKKIEQATGGDADVEMSDDGMKITGKTEEGDYALTTGEETEIPDDFPSDVFIYRPSTAVMAMKVPGGHSVTLSTGDDREKVVEAYKKKMEAEGWSEEGSMNMGSNTMLVYGKDGRNASVNIVPSDDKVQINLTVGK
jgi:hypothetical protein